MNKEKVKITGLDVRIAVAVAICYLTSTVLKQFGVMVSWGDTKLEIIQGMTSCFAARTIPESAGNQESNV